MVAIKAIRRMGEPLRTRTHFWIIDLLFSMNQKEKLVLIAGS
jgi:hypothetical protein